MINLNTNLGAMIVFSNLKVSTNGLNTAIERMTSGYKINRAGDNAANFSINTKPCRMNKTVGKRSDQFDKMLYGSSRSQQKNT